MGIESYCRSAPKLKRTEENMQNSFNNFNNGSRDQHRWLRENLAKYDNCIFIDEMIENMYSELKSETRDIVSNLAGFFSHDKSALWQYNPNGFMRKRVGEGSEILIPIDHEFNISNRPKIREDLIKHASSKEEFGLFDPNTQLVDNSLNELTGVHRGYHLVGRVNQGYLNIVLQLYKNNDCFSDDEHLLFDDLVGIINGKFSGILKSSQDPLTGLLNQRAIRKVFPRRSQDFLENSGDYSLIFMDIDHFKSINDTYGHETGDMVLETFANLVYDSVRKGDVTVRYGGEEFLVFLPGNAELAYQKAEDIKKNLSDVVFVDAFGKHISPDVHPITASYGIDSTSLHRGNPEIDLSLNGLQARADAAMYAVKSNGRDGIKIWDPSLMK
ncbi:hypothetical protein C0585_05360 [Candidatus Woesearchaeota archaeon]|nr:MAG: hypothetical protein C0585_05360 [Candidatus Woesearchaeota archaeon]